MMKKRTSKWNKVLNSKKLVVTGFVAGMLISGTAAFANTASIPATVTIENTPILAAAVTPETLNFNMQRGAWDTKSITIESTGDIPFTPEITYTSASASEFDGAGANIASSDKVILKSGNGSIYDFSSPETYKPNGDLKMNAGQTINADISVGAGQNVPEGISAGPAFNVEVNLIP